MKDKDKKMLFGIGIVFLFLASVGFSYAYFTASIVNNEVKDQVVETGTLSLRYVDGAEIVMNNIKPGQTITKTVYVANTGTLDAVYNLVWQELTNEITKDEILIEGTCIRMNATTEVEDGTCEGITSTAISSKKIKSKITIEPNIVHKYDLTITFKDTNAAQNYNQGKKFTGVLGIKENETRDPVSFENDSWATIANAVSEGNTDKYNVGDTKEIDLGDTYGKHTVRIANKSTPDECSSNNFFSQTACGFVIEFTDILFTSTLSETEFVSTNVGKKLDGDVYNSLPEDLKDSIINTEASFNRFGGTNDVYLYGTKLYLLNAREIFDYSVSSAPVLSSATRQLDYYKNNNVSASVNQNFAVKKDSSGQASEYWLRYSPYLESNSNMYFSYSSNGYNVSSILLVASNGVSPAFRIG